jgi:hypothetical protein
MRSVPNSTPSFRPPVSNFRQMSFPPTELRIRFDPTALE